LNSFEFPGIGALDALEFTFLFFLFLSFLHRKRDLSMGYGRLAREFSQRPPAILQTNYVIKLRHHVQQKKETPRPTSHAPAKRRLTVASPITIREDPTTDSDYPKDFVCFLFKQLRSTALPAMAIRSQRVQPRSVAASRNLVALRQAPRRGARARRPVPSSEFQSMSFCRWDELRAASLALGHFAYPLRIEGIGCADDDHRHDLPRRGLDRLWRLVVA
jgi:hypothetical protein